MKKEIIISEKNAGTIAAVLEEVQRRSRTRTITAQDIMNTCSDISERLSISKAAMDGVSFSADLHAQHFPSAYHGTPESTQFSAVYRRGSWRLTSVYRAAVSAPTKGIWVRLTDAAKAAIISKYSYMEV